MTKISEFPEATVLTGATFVIQQGGSNKRAPLALIEELAGEGGGGGSGPLTAVVDSDVGTTAVTATTFLTFTVETDKVYKLTGSLFYRTTDTEKGISVAIGGTAGAVSIVLQASALDSTGDLITKATKAKNTLLEFPSALISGDDNYMELSGLIYTASAGTITLGLASPVLYDYCAVQKGSGAMLQELGTISGT